ncbi:MAG: hypothetical protein COA66_04210 [Arcobacter sp.]|nr:MAG: hypothetical protein COA66_04210 [Arcobacter sp.]
MNLIFEGLHTMFFQLKVVTILENERAVLVFIIACAIIGFIAVLLDLCIFILKKESVLELEHSFKTTLVFLLMWSFGAAVIGLLGQMVNLFQVSLSASVAVGFTWPLLFTKIIKKLKEKEENEEPEQKSTEEG